MALYSKYSDIKDGKVQGIVLDAIDKIRLYCIDIGSRLHEDFTITIENKTVLFFDIRHSNPHYYIEILRETGIINVKGYGYPTIKIVGGGD